MRTVDVTGGTLYHLALKYLNDATQWSRIAQLNNLLDPVIDGVATIKIPPVNPAATGGVLVR